MAITLSILAEIVRSSFTGRCRIPVNCAAEHLCDDEILNPVQDLLWRANYLSREGPKTNHDKLSSPKQQSNDKASNYIALNW